MSTLNVVATARGARRRMARRGFGPVPARIVSALQSRGIEVARRGTTTISLSPHERPGEVEDGLAPEFWVAAWISDLVDTFSWSMSNETLADSIKALAAAPEKRVAVSTTLALMREAGAPMWTQTDALAAITGIDRPHEEAP